jgi:hypothetical protein
MQNVRKNINMIKISLEVHYNYIIHETNIYIDDALIFARAALLVFQTKEVAHIQPNIKT